MEGPSCYMYTESPGMDTVHHDFSNDFSRDMSHEEDVYEQLAEKEKDLMLAAELGKALLERNEELSQQNEQLLEECGHQLEELRQQKHDLHLLLENKEGEYENRIRELEKDITLLREELEERDEHIHSSEREKTHVIQELTQQNERLNDQLRKTVQQEQGLQTQIQTLRDQINLRKSTMHDHVNQLEVLGQEIHLLTDRKIDLERRITTVCRERDSLLEKLEESHDHNTAIERENKEKDIQLQQQESEIKRLQEENVQLHSKLDKLSLHSHGSCNGETERPRGDSLFNELQDVGDTSACDIGPFQSSFCDNYQAEHGDISFLGQHSNMSGFHGNHMYDEVEDFECDDEAVAMTTNVDMEIQTDDDVQLRQEVIGAYHKLVEMCNNLKGHHIDWSTSGQQDHPGQCISVSLQQVIEDLKQLIESVLSKETKDVLQSDDIPQQIHSLRSELVDAQEQLSKLKHEIMAKDVDLQTKTEDLSLLTDRIEIAKQHSDLAEVQHERNHMYDEGASNWTMEEVVQQARAERDDAVERKNHMAQELAKAKLDLVSLDKQLMQAVEQKVFLSQQLENWQEDMHEVIATNVNKQILNQKGHRRSPSDQSLGHRQTQSEHSDSSPETGRKSRLWFW